MRLPSSYLANLVNECNEKKPRKIPGLTLGYQPKQDIVDFAKEKNAESLSDYPSQNQL